ncbi:HEAT repeat domain-containing protein [Streptomyces griseofuscus]|uniref:HEAT repeat domain-containing protein n=1 Tax=Streptomyces griseofuscus TaxID=146922 RepID=UPI0038123700
MIAGPVPLDGLDAVPWADLAHAYGATADVPAILRALARPGPDPEREERLDELDSAIYHQGGAVYSAGAAALPFLLELAAAPGLPLRAAIVELLGRFAALPNDMLEPWSSDEHTRSCRAALIAGHDLLVALLDDTDPAVRAAVADLLWEYARWSPRAQDAARALADRDAVEPDLALRVSLRLAGARAAAQARASGSPSAAPLTAAVRRLVEAVGRDADALTLARLAAARRLDPAAASWRDLLDAALAPATPRRAYPAWREDGAHLATALCALCGDDPAAHLDIVRALIGHECPRVRTGALQAAGDAMLRRRSAVPALVPLLGAALKDPEPENRARAADLLAAAGDAGAAFDDRLAAALDDPHRPAALRAAWALARHGDVRAVPALTHALDHEEDDGFGPSAHYGGNFYWFTRPPLREALEACAPAHGPLLVPALRSALARCLTGRRPADGAATAPVDLPRLHLLCDALAACGPAAAEALPELAALLAAGHPRPACTVIEALGPAAGHCRPLLERAERTALAAASAGLSTCPTAPADSSAASVTSPTRPRPPGPVDHCLTALTVARTRFAVDGDEAALLRTVDAVLTSTAALCRGVEETPGRPRSAAAAAAIRDTAALASAVARCLAALGPGAGASRMRRPEQWLRANEWRWRSHESVAVARAHRRVTGDSGLALQVFGRVLETRPGAAYSPIELAALRALTDLGPEARALAPLLRACRDRDERLCDGGGWRGMALDEEARQRAAAALSAGAR